MTNCQVRRYILGIKKALPSEQLKRFLYSKNMDIYIMPQMNKSIKHIATGLAISFSLLICPSKSEANPAMLLAPELCATGIGCVVGAVILIGGVAYIVREHNGQRILIPRDVGVTYSRPISGIDAAKLGDAHWAEKVTDCYKIGKRIGKVPIAHHPAAGSGKGFWCIFPGEQTSFDEGAK